MILLTNIGVYLKRDIARIGRGVTFLGLAGISTGPGNQMAIEVALPGDSKTRWGKIVDGISHWALYRTRNLNVP